MDSYHLLTIGVNFLMLVVVVGGMAMKFTDRISRLEAHQSDMKEERDDIKSTLKDIQDRLPPKEYWADLNQRVRHLEVNSNKE